MEVHRGIVWSYDSTNHKADVLLVGSMSRMVLGVDVAHHIGTELMDDGTACAVAFFAEGGTGVVLATFDGAPDSWVTESLLAFDTATQTELDAHEADADAHHDTPGYYQKTTSSTQALTTSFATYDTLTQEITVPDGVTYNVVAMAAVEMKCAAYTGWNLRRLRLNADGAVGSAMNSRSNAVNEIETVATMAGFQLSSTTTVLAEVMKSQDRNTEEAQGGVLVIVYWEAT